MSNLSSSLIIALYTFAFVLGTSFVRLKPVLTFTTLVISVAVAVQYFGEVTSPLLNENGPIFYAFCLSLISVFLSQKVNWDFVFRLCVIILPLSFVCLITNHLFVFLLSSVSLFFFLLADSSRTRSNDFLELYSTFIPFLTLIVLFVLFASIGYTNIYIGSSFIAYEVAAMMAFITLVISFIFLLLISIKSMNYRDSDLGAMLIIVLPVIGMKLIFFSQVLLYQFNVEHQEGIYELAKWIIFFVLIVLGLASHHSKNILRFSIISFLSLSIIAFCSFAIQPTGEIVLPVFILLFVSSIISYRIAQDYRIGELMPESYTSLKLMLLPLAPILASLFIVLRMILSDGLELVALAIVVNCALVLASGLKIYYCSVHTRDTSLANIILPMRTIFLLSCTLLSTCLLVIF